MVDNAKLAELLEEEPKTQDPELLKLALLLANKVMDLNKLKFDEDGAMMVRTVNW